MFETYVKPHGIDDLKFFYGNQEAVDWYDPIKPYAALEYAWVREHVKLDGAVVLDGGAHHGHYSVIFKGAREVLCVEPIPENCRHLAKNLSLNKMKNVRIIQGALSQWRSTQLWEGMIVECYPPSDQAFADATVVKLDIEGAEYAVFPLALTALPHVHTWIIECHPHAGDPDAIARLMWAHGLEVWKVDRASLQVIAYLAGSAWLTHDTLIGIKKGLTA